MYVEDSSVVEDFRRENGSKELSERFLNDLSEEYSIKYGPNQVSVIEECFTHQILSV